MPILEINQQMTFCIENFSFQQNPPAPEITNDSPAPRDALSSVPERERRITVCYRNLVREYEQLVHRYLQLYRPPTMVVYT